MKLPHLQMGQERVQGVDDQDSKSTTWSEAHGQVSRVIQGSVCFTRPPSMSPAKGAETQGQTCK